MLVGTIQFLKGWIEGKAEERQLLPLLEPRHPSSPASGISAQWFSVPSKLVPLVLRSLCLAWNYTNSFFGPLVYRWQVVELLALHNCLIQSLIITLFLCTSLYPINSFSLENPG